MLNELILFHVTVSFIYYLIRARHHRGQAGCEAAVAFLIPGFGLAFLLLTAIFAKLHFADGDPSYVYRSFENNSLPLLEHDRQADNIIPIQDALLLEDINTKRRLLSAAVKDNVLQNSEVLLNAIRDEDSEISHYAVSMVNRRSRDSGEAFYRLQKRVQQAPDDITVLKQYVNAVDVYLKNNPIDIVSRVKMQRISAAVLERLLGLDRSEKKYFLMKINSEIELKNYQQAQKFCRLFRQSFPHREEPYLVSIKLAYYLLDNLKIRQVIWGLKHSDIQFSKAALDIIRFWDQGERNASK